MRFALLFLILIGSAFAASISECTLINSSGKYDLVRDLSDGSVFLSLASENACILVSASDVWINCHDHLISSPLKKTKYAILLDSGNFRSLKNISISGCDIRGYQTGIFSPKTNVSSFVNLTISGLSGYGLSFANTHNSVFANNSIYNTNDTGIYLSGNSNSNFILNNSIRNSNHHGIALLGNENQVLGNVVFDNRGDGILLLGQSSSNLINLNTIYGNLGDGIGFELNGESRNSNLDNLDYANHDLSARGSTSSPSNAPISRPLPPSSPCCAPAFVVFILVFLSKST